MGLFLLCVVLSIMQSCNSPMPKDYKIDQYTKVTTWTDEEGRSMMKDQNGNVRELSNVYGDTE